MQTAGCNSSNSHTALRCRCQHPHFIDKETETQTGAVNFHKVRWLLSRRAGIPTQQPDAGLTTSPSCLAPSLCVGQEGEGKDKWALPSYAGVPSLAGGRAGAWKVDQKGKQNKPKPCMKRASKPFAELKEAVARAWEAGGRPELRRRLMGPILDLGVYLTILRSHKRDWRARGPWSDQHHVLGQSRGKTHPEWVLHARCSALRQEQRVQKRGCHGPFSSEGIADQY